MVVFSPKKTVLLSNEKMSHAATGLYLFYAFNHSQLFRITTTSIFDVLHVIVPVTIRPTLQNLLEGGYALEIIRRSNMLNFILEC